MEYRYFSAIFRSCVVLPILWVSSNAALPHWCQNPAAIEYFAISASAEAADFELQNGIVYLCRVTGANDPSALFAVLDGEESLIEFHAADVTFKMMSGNIFWIVLTPSNQDARHLKGRFLDFNDFIRFHRVVRQDRRFSPQKFRIKGLERYAYVRGASRAVVSPASFARPVTFSQYSIDVDVVNDDDSAFVIEDEFADDEFINVESSIEDELARDSSKMEIVRESYLSFHPSQFRNTRHQIYSQVVLTSADNENMYYIIRLDTPENAANFANFIGQFATPDTHGLLLPPALENFLNDRK